MSNRSETGSLLSRLIDLTAVHNCVFVAGITVCAYNIGLQEWNIWRDDISTP